jgi:hypothetical protein
MEKAAPRRSYEMQSSIGSIKSRNNMIKILDYLKINHQNF